MVELGQVVIVFKCSSQIAENLNLRVLRVRNTILNLYYFQEEAVGSDSDRSRMQQRIVRNETIRQ